MKRLKDVYSDAEYEVRLKARIFFWVLVGLIAAFGLNTIAQIFGNFTLSDWFITGLVAVLCVSLVLLRRGRYDLSATIACVAIFPILFVTMWVGGYIARYTLAEYASLLVVLFFIMTIFVRNRRWTIPAGISILLVYSGTVALWAIRGKIDTVGSGPLLEQFITPFLVLCFGLTLAVLIQVIFSVVSKDLRLRLDEIGQARRKSALLVQSIAGQLDKSSELTANAGSTASASVEIERSVGSIKERVSKVGARMDALRAALATIKESLGMLTADADAHAGIVGRSGAAVQEMIRSIESVSDVIRSRGEAIQGLMRTAQDGEAAARQTDQSFKTVSTHISEIGEITNVIADIASSTNLLSMNAAIEAAHAGHSGTGFAVVAAEIRSLAESAEKNTRSIERSVKDLMGSVQEAGGKVAQNGKAFSRVQGDVGSVQISFSEIRESIGELGRHTEELTGSSHQLDDASQRIHSHIKQVAEAYTQIFADVSQIADVLQEISEGMNEIVDGTGSIRGAVAEIQELALKLKDQTGQLKESL